MNDQSQPKMYLRDRQVAIRKEMAKLDLDTLLLSKPTDIAYLTDFDSAHALAVLTPDTLVVLMESHLKPQVKEQAPWVSARFYNDDLGAAIVKCLLDCKAKRVGLDAEDVVLSQLMAISRGVGVTLKSERVEFVPSAGIMAHVRQIKDDNEVARIRAAVGITEDAFLAVRAQIQAGQKENYLAGLLTFEMRSRSAEEVSFPVQVATGTNGAHAYHRSSDSVMAMGDAMILDWGAKYKGYCCDVTRTLFFGSVSSRLEKMHRIVLETLNSVLELVRPGVTNRQVAQLANDLIEAAGYKLMHGIGHGVGRDYIERPSFGLHETEEELQPGMVVCIEPGVYVPGVGGVRIEDVVRVTHCGNESLSNLDRTLEGNRII